MDDRHVLIIGGGLAGLSTGCYALRSGYRATIVEHGLALGGVCTSWHRDPYVVDGCIHWLTGGAFDRVYEELEILPHVQLRTLETWVTYRDARTGLQIPFTRDLDALVARLAAAFPDDAAELVRIRRGAAEIVAMKPPLDAPELASLRDTLRTVWEMRHGVASLVHFHQPLGEWASAHLVSPQLRRLLTQVLPDTAPALFLLMVLGYLERGYLSRPIGGTAAFRDALVRSYRHHGGEARLHATVDEVLVRDGRARGVRLADGTMLYSDVVVSTASTPETVLRLLGGRYDAAPTRERLANWRLFDPIVFASFGVAREYPETSGLLLVDGIAPIQIGGRTNDHLSMRVCNDDSCFAPPGHTVIQVMLPTDYEWWATRGSRCGAEKDALVATVLTALEPHFPGMRDALRMTDVATPLTYWNEARAWRGAYEGWMPTAASFFGHVKKKLDGLEDFYMAGQWVEPGGGVPTALSSGRQVMQLVCADDHRAFVPRHADAHLSP